MGGAYLPFFGAWLEWRGLGPEEIGALLASTAFLRVAVSPLAGLVADARNDRRSVMLMLSLLAFLGILLLNGAEGAVLIAACAVPALLAWSAIGPLLESATVRLAERHGFDYGRVRLWGSVTFVLGNIVSGVAVSLFGLVVIAPWLASAVGLLVIAAYMLPPPRNPRALAGLGIRLRATLAEARELGRHRMFLLFLLAASLGQGSHAMYYAYGGLHWRALGLDGALIGILWPLGVIAEIALFAFSTRMFKHVGAARLLALGGLGCVLRWTLMAFDPGLPVLVVAQFLHAISFALSHLGAVYFVLRAVPARLSATGQSLYAVCAYGLAMGIGTFLSGPLYAVVGGRAYLLMAAFGAAGLGLSLLLGRLWNGDRLVADGERDEDADAI